MDNGFTPLPQEIQITNRHSLWTDGQARGEEEEEVKGGDTKSQTLRKSNNVSVHNVKVQRRTET